jgi:hypothetical protein
MERMTYVLLNSVTENRAGLLWFVNQLLPCAFAGLAEMGTFAAEKEGRTGFPSFFWVR